MAVTFMSRNKNLSLKVKEGHVIKFENGIYVAETKKEADEIKKTSAFKNNKIAEITEQEQKLANASDKSSKKDGKKPKKEQVEKNKESKPEPEGAEVTE